VLDDCVRGVVWFSVAIRHMSLLALPCLTSHRARAPARLRFKLPTT